MAWRHSATPARSRSGAAVEVEVLEDRRLLSAAAGTPAASAPGGPAPRDTIQERQVIASDQARLHSDLHRLRHDLARTVRHSHATLHELVDMAREGGAIHRAQEAELHGTVSAAVRSPVSAVHALATLGSLQRTDYDFMLDTAMAVLDGWETDADWLKYARRDSLLQDLANMGVAPEASARYVAAVRAFAKSADVSHERSEQLRSDGHAILEDELAIVNAGHPVTWPSDPTIFLFSHLPAFVRRP